MLDALCTVEQISAKEGKEEYQVSIDCRSIKDVEYDNRCRMHEPEIMKGCNDREIKRPLNLCRNRVEGWAHNRFILFSNILA